VDPEESTLAVFAANREGLDLLQGSFREIVAGQDRDVYEARVRELMRLGADEAFARRLITLRFLDQALEILRVARETGSDVLETGRAYYRVSESLAVPWIREAVFTSAGDDRWEQRAAQALADDLTRAHHRLVAQVMTRRGGEPDAGEAASRLLAIREREVRRFRGLLAELREEVDTLGLPALSVAVREISVLSENVAPERQG
jgi:glutamate dehydrogenase